MLLFTIFHEESKTDELFSLQRLATLELSTNVIRYHESFKFIAIFHSEISKYKLSK